MLTRLTPPPLFCCCSYGMTVIPTFAQSVPLHDNHIGTRMNPEQDCLHYCMPGVPQVSQGGGGVKGGGTAYSGTTMQELMCCIVVSRVLCMRLASGQCRSWQ